MRKIKIIILSVLFDPEVRGGMAFRNVNELTPSYTASNCPVTAVRI
jgi:hypothetical protein